MKIQIQWVGYGLLASLISAMSAQPILALDTISQVDQLSQTSPEQENTDEADEDAENIDEETAEDAEPLRIVVTATRTEENILDVPRSITVIDREDIERELLFTNNLPDILGKLVPGYGAPTQEDRTTATLRGRPVVILIDGVPQTPNNDGFSTSLSTIAPELVERIEVLRGPSAIYGDGGTGGVVNIITRRPTEDSIAYNLSIGADVGLTSSQRDRYGYSGQFGVSAAGERGDGLLSISYDNAGAQFNADGDRILPNGIANNERLVHRQDLILG